MIHEPLTKLQCSLTSDGSGAAILASERFVDAHGLWDRAIEIVGQSMVTDMRSSFEDKSAISIVGGKTSERAAKDVYEQAQVGPDDVDVIELHDCFSANELITYEALGLCDEGEAHKLVEAEATTAQHRHRRRGRGDDVPAGRVIKQIVRLITLGTVARCSNCRRY